MAADFAAKLLDHGLVGIRHKQHGMRHAGVQRMDGLRARGKGDLLVQPQVLGLSQVHRHAIAIETRLDDARAGFEGEAAFMPVSFWTNRAKQRAPLPHISAALPSLL